MYGACLIVLTMFLCVHKDFFPTHVQCFVMVYRRAHGSNHLFRFICICIYIRIYIYIYIYEQYIYLDAHGVSSHDWYNKSIGGQYICIVYSIRHVHIILFIYIYIHKYLDSFPRAYLIAHEYTNTAFYCLQTFSRMK